MALLVKNENVVYFSDFMKAFFLDEDYVNEWFLSIKNGSDKEMTFPRGTKLAQAILEGLVQNLSRIFLSRIFYPDVFIPSGLNVRIYI